MTSYKKAFYAKTASLTETEKKLFGQIGEGIYKYSYKYRSPINPEIPTQFLT